MRAPGTVILMGSGELTDSMTHVHRWAASRVDGPVQVAFLDTPAGFEPNADDISDRACAYISRHLGGVACSVVSFKSAADADAEQVKSVQRRLEQSNYIFAGPGSPTYAIRNWRGTPVLDAIRRRLHEGAQLVLASAAAISAGRYALPVYEVFKVGEDPHWVDGLNLLAPYGLEPAIVTHWNNAEGGNYDTRFCFMGQARFERLERSLPDGAVVLGIDEHTACVLDLAEASCSVMGVGGITIRRGGREQVHATGTTFDLAELGSGEAGTARAASAPPATAAEPTPEHARETLLREVARAERDAGGNGANGGGLGRRADSVYELARAVDQGRAAGVSEEEVGRAVGVLRERLDEWSRQLASDEGARGDLAPFVELLISVRSRLRAEHNFALADEIRDRLHDAGVVLEDAREGTTWRRA